MEKKKFLILWQLYRQQKINSRVVAPNALNLLLRSSSIIWLFEKFLSKNEIVFCLRFQLFSLTLMKRLEISREF